MIHFKKNLNFIFKGIGISIVLLFTSCTKENDTALNIENDDASIIKSKDLMASASIDEKLAYKDYHLANLVKEVMVQNPDFGKIDELKFSKENEPAVYLESFLLRTLANKGAGKSALKNSTLESLDAFQDLEGNTWYPVLTKISEGNSSSNADPLFLFQEYDSANEKEYIKAFAVNNDGGLSLSDSNFTEEEFDNLNNTSKAGGSIYSVTLKACQPPTDYQKVSYSGCGGGGGAPSTFKLKTIKIKDKKESWLEAADIHHTIVFWSNVQNGTYYSDTNYNPSGFEIRKVRNSDMNKNLSVDELLSSRTASGVLQHVIFEHDNWPAIIQSSTISGPNGSTFNIRWRSWNSDYNHQLLNVNQSYSGIPNIVNFTENNGAIYYAIQ